MNLIIGLAAAMAVGLLFTRIVKLVHLPNVTGYLLAGLLVGPHFLNFMSNEMLESSGIIVTMALGFIAFSIGGEFKAGTLKQIGPKAVVITLFEALTAVLFVDVILLLAGFDTPLAISLGAIAAATAPAATLMVVRQYKAKGPVTSTLLPVVAMDDAVALMAFSISAAIAQSMVVQHDGGLASILFKPLMEIGLSLVVGFLIGMLASMAMRFFHSKDNFLCIVITAIVLGVGLSEQFGLSSLLLCMAMGAAVTNLRQKSNELLAWCDRWTPPIYLLFFVLSGASLDLSAIPSVGLLGVLYIVARSAGKCLGAFTGATITHAHENVRKYLGLTLLPQAGVAIGMAQMATVMLPSYAGQIRTVVLCATLIYELFGPVITKIALTKAGEIASSPRVKATASK